MIRTFGFLYGMTLRNALVQRLRRLRQPKYLVGAIAGGLYFYFMFFRHMFRGGVGPSSGGVTTAPAILLPLSALLLFIIVVVSWILSNRRAALQFSEAEVAFLFPAPVPRRSLINYKLLRSQIAIFVSAFFLSLFIRRGAMLGGNAFIHAAGWWLILSTLDLHFLAASFVRERLLDFGLNPVRRRLLVGGLVLALVGATWIVVRQTVPLPGNGDIAGYREFVGYVDRVLNQPPISWVLVPFKVVVRPYFAADVPAFLSALAPALLVLLLHYLWVVHSSVSFEEASIELAARRAERAAARTGGRLGSGAAGVRKPRVQPFPLAARGWVPLAFLWKNLIALGPFFRLRTWIAACALAAGLLAWLGADPVRRPLLQAIGGGAFGIGCWLFVFGPMFLRREVQQTLGFLEITKSWPLKGWQIVVGQLLTPIVLMTFGEWFLLLIAALALGTTTSNARLAFMLGGAGACSIALILPPLCGLMLCIPYTGVLYFPAWAQASGSRNAGIEVMGQRLIFLAGYLVVLAVAVLPAAAAGALAFFIVKFLVADVAAIFAGTVVTAAVLALEFAGAVHWLGGKIERFDLSAELPR